LLKSVPVGSIDLAESQETNQLLDLRPLIQTENNSVCLIQRQQNKELEIQLLVLNNNTIRLPLGQIDGAMIPSRDTKWWRGT
jgi:hypothetical protein